jgi:hypothetical protein
VTEPTRKYWFPAKRYGWGWGLPSAWQGWAFLVAWLIASTAGSSLLGSSLLPNHPGLLALFGLTMIAILLAVCFAKGEPPRWRWGDRDKPPAA